MPFKIKSAIASAAIVTMSGHAIAEDSAAGQQDSTAAMKAEVQKQFFVGMVALRDYCKQADPANAATIDANWAKNTAKASFAELKTVSAEPDFAEIVAANVKAMVESSKDPADAEEIKAGCTGMMAPE